ncbi:hypothetical protein V5799_029640 [Amblyomma americanum]|uniref:Uncharacterized protein n=1 Tax=Amblyomma americanum TaxID=6943 RepID=A0AAQ4EQR2_AMBAM
MERFLVQARLVLWQRVAVQTLRRHWLASALEVLATVACFTQVSRLAPVPSELGNFSSAKLFPAHFAFPGEWPSGVVYQPPSTYADDLLASYRKRKEIFEYLRVRSPVRAVRSEEELRAACRQLVRETYERNYVLCVSLHQQGVGGNADNTSHSSAGYPSLNYTLHMFAGGLPRVGFRDPVEFGDQEPAYLERVIQKTQVWIDTQHLTVIDRNARIKKEWYSFVMQLSGLLEAAYWFGQLAIGVLMGAVSSSIVLLFMILCGSEGSTYLTSEGLDAGPLVVTFLLFSCLSTLHALLVASLFRTGNFRERSDILR